MNEHQYHQMVDALFLKIEAWLETSEQDIDFDSQEGILTISFAMGGTVILSRQAPLQEVWLACVQGAFHFQYHQGEWVTLRQEKLAEILVACAKQANVVLDINEFTI
ncbi:iron donor protein CyaY [Candidatus Berkiella aquae]|uniref:Frataxin-like protein n=1 Tax=Candidatus Berkiella aquae TaxID=295108 RepID=A0A0Q9YMS7_9GAMM|nr:iron donor protein CyaY [Candidatus Berkiella aquae]MCS5712704.1 iron donor protein CyaY [Candidatus Berkiella aquae]